MEQVNCEVAHTWWRRKYTDFEFWRLHTHTVGYLCKSKQLAKRQAPTICQQIEGTTQRERDNRKHPQRKLKLKSSCGCGAGKKWTLSVRWFYADWSSKSSCGLQPPNPPELVPVTTLPQRSHRWWTVQGVRILFGKKSDRLFFKEIPAVASTLGVFHKAGWRLPRRRGDSARHPETEEQLKLHFLTGFKIQVGNKNDKTGLKN